MSPALSALFHPLRRFVGCVALASALSIPGVCVFAQSADSPNSPEMSPEKRLEWLKAHAPAPIVAPPKPAVRPTVSFRTTLPINGPRPEPAAAEPRPAKPAPAEPAPVQIRSIENLAVKPTPAAAKTRVADNPPVKPTPAVTAKPAAPAVAASPSPSKTRVAEGTKATPAAAAKPVAAASPSPSKTRVAETAPVK